MKQTLTLDAEGWISYRDFYTALLAAVGAPAWHSWSVDALIDTMIWGDDNSAKPPYVVRIINARALDSETRKAVNEAKEGIDIGRNEFRVEEGRDIDVSIEVID